MVEQQPPRSMRKQVGVVLSVVAVACCGLFMDQRLVFKSNNQLGGGEGVTIGEISNVEVQLKEEGTTPTIERQVDDLQVRSMQLDTTNKSSTERQSSPDFILGFSTGHAGSTTYDQVLRGSSSKCPWRKATGKFEDSNSQEKSQVHKPTVELCDYTNRVLIPTLEGKRGNGTYIDLGHYHNRVPGGLECLAQALGERLAFVRIRRNRYFIANSFVARGPTPCKDQSRFRAPVVSYCPHSTVTH